MKTDKEKVIVDDIIEIDRELFKKLDKKIREDKSLPKDEVELWKKLNFFPNTYAEELIKFIEKEYGK